MSKSPKFFYAIMVIGLLFGTVLNPFASYGNELTEEELQQTQQVEDNGEEAILQQTETTEVQEEQSIEQPVIDETTSSDSNEGNPEQPRAPSDEAEEQVVAPTEAVTTETETTEVETTETETTEINEDETNEQEPNALPAARTMQAPVNYGDQFITGATVTTSSGTDINNGTIGFWDRLAIKYTWELPDHTVKAGDTMTVKIPKEFEFQNFNNFEVKDSAGNLVGNAVINPNDNTITVTFTDYPETKLGVKGTMQAWIQMHYSEAAGERTITIEYNGTATIINVDISKGTPNLEEVLSKWGSPNSQDPNIVKWTIRVNLAENEYDNVVIKDILGDGLEMVEGSFHIETVKYENGDEVWGSWVTQQHLIERANNSISSDKKSFEFSLGAISESYHIRYSTKIVKPLVKAQNTVFATFDNNEPIKYEDYYYVEGGSGEADGYENASVVLSKVDPNGNHIISDVTRFALYKLEGKKETLIQQDLKTDENGKIGVEGLYPGQYFFVETVAPTGYVLNDERVSFEIVDGADKAVFVSKVNDYKLGNVTLTKIADHKDAQGKDITLPGAVFELQTADGTTKQSNLVVNENGQLVVTDLAPGSYQFVETKAPAGYELDNTPVKFDIVVGQTEQMVYVSKVNKAAHVGSVVLTKYNEDKSKTLTGAIFELRLNGEVIASDLMTDASGTLQVNELKAGTYEFIETKAPAGYELDQTPVTFTIEVGKTETVNVFKTNKLTPGKVVLTKVDANSNKALQGAVFELQTKDGVTLQSALQTNADGKLEVKDLAPGSYQFVETKAPAGYQLDATPLIFTIEEGQVKALEVTKTNELTPGTVVLTKVDQVTGETLAGAVFELQTKDGQKVQEALQTGADGKLEVKNLAPGSYQFIETKAPAGYELDATPIVFTIEKGQEKAVQVTKANNLTPGTVVLTKVDQATGETLAGAVFELQTKDGQKVQAALQTNAAGKLEVKDLAPGSYQFIETKAPAGYDLDATPIVFTIEKGQAKAVEVTKTNTLTKGAVVLTKLDKTTAEKLAGAQFDLQDATGKVLQSGLETGTDGKLEVKGLAPGNYQFVETKAPTGYDLDATPVTFTIEKGQVASVQVTKANQLTPGGVVLTKVDAATAEKLAGAQFELQDASGKTLQSNLETGKDGKLEVKGLAPGSYQLVETKAPTGYDLDRTPVLFMIERAQKAVVEVTKTNTLTKGSVVLTKVDATTAEKLAGAVFELQTKDGNKVKEALQTGTDGKLEVKDLAPGDYQFVETKAPAGYDLDATPVVFTIEKGQVKEVEVTKTNTLTKGAVVLTKVDATNAMKLSGAVFELQNAEGKVLQSNLEVQTDGTLQVKDLVPGDYQFVETKAPAGYMLDKTPVKFTIEKGQTVAVGVTKTNQAIPYFPPTPVDPEPTPVDPEPTPVDPEPTPEEPTTPVDPEPTPPTDTEEDFEEGENEPEESAPPVVTPPTVTPPTVTPPTVTPTPSPVVTPPTSNVQNEQARLPQTNGETSMWYMALGAVLLVMAGTLLAMRRRQQ